MNVKLTRNRLANCRCDPRVLVMRINNFLTQVYRVCFHLASVQVYSLSVSYSIQNRCMPTESEMFAAFLRCGRRAIAVNYTGVE